MAEEHAKEDHVGELAGARLDDGRVVVADENDHREEGHGEAEQGGADGDQRGGVRPADELYGNGFAAWSGVLKKCRVTNEVKYRKKERKVVLAVLLTS